MKKSAVKDEWFLDDWGPMPEPPASAWDRLRTAGEALLVVAVFTLGMLMLVLGFVVYVFVLAVLICLYPFVSACEGTCKTANEGTTGAPGRSSGGIPPP